MARLRLDQLLVLRGLCETRSKAHGRIMAGEVLVEDRPVTKAGALVAEDAVLRLRGETLPFVSRGGLKLDHALTEFHLDPRGWVCFDAGSSTGGFTDCLLQRGAAKVFAVDVGHGQLAWKLRTDPRVVVREKTNARHLKPESFPESADLVVADCSFISLKKILPPAIPLLKPDGRIVALIKPQFEAGKAEADKGRGVITDPAVHERVLAELREFVAAQAGVCWRGVVESSLLGPAGNKEFLALIEKEP